MAEDEGAEPCLYIATKKSAAAHLKLLPGMTHYHSALLINVLNDKADELEDNGEGDEFKLDPVPDDEKMVFDLLEQMSPDEMRVILESLNANTRGMRSNLIPSVAQVK